MSYKLHSLNSYAIKKIRLPADSAMEQKILREVTIWSRMTHPHIVRYHTSWVETETRSVDAMQALDAIDSSQSAPSADNDDVLNFGVDLHELDFLSVNHMSTSVNIHFGNSDDPTGQRPSSASASSSSDHDAASAHDVQINKSLESEENSDIKLDHRPKRHMYIQMEVCHL